MSILPVRVRGKHRATPADLRAEITRLNAENEDLACALRKAAGEVDEKTRDLNAAVIVAVGRLQKITELEGHLKAKAGKVVRRDAEVKRLAASLKNAHLELERVKPRVTTANNPARIPPYAPTDPSDWTVIDAAGQGIQFGTWAPFPPDPDGEDTVAIPLADILVGCA